MSVNELSARLDLTMHHYNKQGHDEYYAGAMEVILSNQQPALFEVVVHNPDSPFLEVIIRKEGYQVVRIQPESKVCFEDGVPDRIIVFAVFAPLIFSAIAQIKLQESVAEWDDTTQDIRALVGLEPLYHLTVSQTVEWMNVCSKGFEYFMRAVLKEYSEH